MAAAIYPSGFRENYFASTYSEMAMESYYFAKLRYEEVKASGFSASSAWEVAEMNKHIISTIVFSAMCIESFLNNYAAACLGDSEFYENFDKLSALSKLQLIAKFILKVDIDKGESYYSSLKRLFRERDSYVHNKSRRSKYQGLSASEYEEFAKNCFMSFDEEIYEEAVFSKEEIDADMRGALDALKTIRNVALFFDKHDSEVLAISLLFHPSGVFWGHEREIKYKSVVFSDLGLKVEKQGL